MIRIGDVLEDRYLIERKIGKGGSSIVYGGIQIRTGRKIAIKEIGRAGTDSFAGKSLQYLKQIRHQGLPMILDVLESTDSVRIVMEYVPGHTLQREMERRQQEGRLFSVEEVLQISLDIAAILRYLHTRPEPLVFRDLKPENIILCPDGRAMLVDLESISGCRQKYEKDYSVIGTTGYAAPEQYKGETVQSSQADLYSLGAVMHYLLTGIVPGLEPFSFRRITEVNPSLGKGGAEKWMRLQRLEQVVDKCICFRKEDRYQTAEELIEDLDRIRRGVALRRKSRRADVVQLLLLTAALVSMGFFLRSGRMIGNLKEEGAAYCLMKAESASEEEVDHWIRAALEFQPGNPEAFSLLLDRMQQDGAFSEEEQMRFRTMLSLTAEGEVLDHEALLARNKAEQIRLAYRLGAAGLNMAEGLPDYKTAGEWFRLIRREIGQWIPNSQAEAEEKDLLKKKSEMLEMICRYRGDILEGAFRADTPVGLSEYWKQLTELLQEERPEELFLAADLVLWREITGFLSDWAVELRETGGSWAEQQEILLLIKDKALFLLEQEELLEYPALKGQLELLSSQADLVDRKRQLLEEAEKKEKRTQEYGR